MFQFLNRTNRCSDLSLSRREAWKESSFNSSIGLTAVLTMNSEDIDLIDLANVSIPQSD